MKFQKKTFKKKFRPPYRYTKIILNPIFRGGHC